MLRREARQRRDYLYRRALTLRDAETASKRRALKASLASGKPLDPSIARDAPLQRDFKYDEPVADRTAQDELDLDDEYAVLSGVRDPSVLVMTSRAPSSRLRAFGKEMAGLLHPAVMVNRGGMVLEEMVREAKRKDVSDIVVLHEHRGTPTAMTVSHLPHGPTASFSLHNVVLRRDMEGTEGRMNTSYPHLIFEGFETRLGNRVVQILKHLFPPREGGRKIGNRVVTFKNVEDSVEVRHHGFVPRMEKQSAELVEEGPRMTMRLFEIRGGTLESKEGDREWHLSNYTRTSKKKDYL